MSSGLVAASATFQSTRVRDARLRCCNFCRLKESRRRFRELAILPPYSEPAVRHATSNFRPRFHLPTPRTFQARPWGLPLRVRRKEVQEPESEHGPLGRVEVTFEDRLVKRMRLDLIDGGGHFVVHQEIHHAVGMKVAHPDRADASLAIQLLHRAPCTVDVADGVMDQIARARNYPVCS